MVRAPNPDATHATSATANGATQRVTAFDEADTRGAQSAIIATVSAAKAAIEGGDSGIGRGFT